MTTIASRTETDLSVIFGATVGALVRGGVSPDSIREQLEISLLVAEHGPSPEFIEAMAKEVKRITSLREA